MYLYMKRGIAGIVSITGDVDLTLLQYYMIGRRK